MPYFALTYDVVDDFAKADPYVKEGLVRTWKVRPWTVVVGQDPSETPPGLPPTT